MHSCYVGIVNPIEEIDEPNLKDLDYAEFEDKFLAILHQMIPVAYLSHHPKVSVRLNWEMLPSTRFHTVLKLKQILRKFNHPHPGATVRSFDWTIWRDIFSPGGIWVFVIWKQ